MMARSAPPFINPASFIATEVAAPINGEAGWKGEYNQVLLIAGHCFFSSINPHCTGGLWQYGWGALEENIFW